MMPDVEVVSLGLGDNLVVSIMSLGDLKIRRLGYENSEDADDAEGIKV